MIIGRVFIGVWTLGFAIGGVLVGLALHSLDSPLWACILVGVNLLYIGSLIDRAQ